MSHGPALRLAVFGSPVARSLSPVIHARFGDQFGLDVDYRAVESDARRFEADLGDFARSGGVGCNVTVPLKGRAFELADRADAASRLARAANTLTRADGQGWLASSTDGAGLLKDLTDNNDFTVAGATVCLLGAGGAASCVLGALLEAGPARIVVANRTMERAEDLVARHRGLGDVAAAGLGEFSAFGPFDLVINATALGHRGLRPDLPREALAPDGLCYDMNYGPAARPLQDHCQAQDIRYQHGLGMLVEQAALSFRTWTGQEPQTAPVLRMLRERVGC